jgi:hypothetical protein
MITVMVTVVVVTPVPILPLLFGPAPSVIFMPAMVLRLPPAVIPSFVRSPSVIVGMTRVIISRVHSTAGKEHGRRESTR